MRQLLLVAVVLFNIIATVTFAADVDSKFGSVGLQVVPISTGELVVLQVPPGTPAAASAIKPGDLIVKIDNFPLAGSDFAETVSRRLWGPQGSQVVIFYLRPGEKGRKSVTLRRAATDPKLILAPAVRDGSGPKGETP